MDIFGDWEKSYEQLPQYMQALKESNPGTVVHWWTLSSATPGVNIFQRVFWAFRPSIKVFRHCRPLITIDGTHLFGKYKGTLLIAMGTDANFQLFPLAFAIVESENIESWTWFMACIRHSVTSREGLCVISDRHVGIMTAMNEPGSLWEYPHAYHRFCIRHLASNVSNRYGTHVKNVFGKAADSHQKKKFDFWFNRVGELKVEARQYLGDIPLEQWSIHHDGGRRYGIATANMSEAFNGVLKGVRCLPIKALVEITFFRVNSYFVTRRGWSGRRLEEGHELSEKAEKTIAENMTKAAYHVVQPYDYERGLFQVETGCGNRAAGKGGHWHTINLARKTCTCEKLKIYKLPCSHILAVCRYRSLSYNDFVDNSFRTTEWKSSYQKTFKPIPDPAYWSPYMGPKIVADPSQKRSTGRPKSTRIHNEMDQRPRGKVKCSLCKQEGHNRTTCSRRGNAGSSG